MTDGEGDTGTGQVPDKEPSDGQTPEEGNSDGEIETPEEAVYASLTTGVYAEDREGTRSAVKEVLVRLYDAGTYDADAETNPVLAELSIDEEETGTLPELTPGEYRIEYVIRNEQFPAEDYEGKELPEGTDYKVLLAEDEAAADAAAGKPEKERDYFAVIPSIQLTGERELTLELVEKEPEGEPDGSLSDKPDSSEDQGTVQDPAEVQNPTGDEKPDQGDSGKSEGTEKDETGDTSEALTLKELQEMDADLAGAAQEKDGGFIRFWDSLFSSEDWSFDVYYVDQEDRYEVELTDNFNLKYQAEFHNSRDLAAGDVEIRMPASLCLDRDEEPVVPTDIAVPEGTPEDPAESRTTSFNYYIDEETGELVFFNYRKMEAGTNAAFQVLYKNVDIMGLTDGTSWEMTPSARVKEANQDPETEEPVWEKRTGTALTGTINSQVKLGTVTKTPYTIAGKSYSPGLYTEEQVSRLVEGGIPEKFAGENFQNYKYVVWEIKLTGNATQPWSLSILEKALTGEAGGEVVGFDRSVTEKEAEGQIFYELVPESRSRSFNYKFRVVTAYPADRVESGTSLENTVTAVLTPLDGVDKAETKSATGKWSYTDYEWVYGDDNIGVIKGIRTDKDPVDRQSYKGWLDAYEESVRTGQDMAPILWRQRARTMAMKRPTSPREESWVTP